MAHSESTAISFVRRGSSAPGADPDRTVIMLRGDQDTANRSDLVAAIIRASTLDDTDVLVDLSGVTFMDASTIGAIVRGENVMHALSRSLGLRAPSLAATHLLELCGLAHLVRVGAKTTIHPSGTAAALATWVKVPSAKPLAEPAPEPDPEPAAVSEISLVVERSEP